MRALNHTHSYKYRLAQDQARFLVIIVSIYVDLIHTDQTGVYMYRFAYEGGGHWDPSSPPQIIFKLNII